MANIMYSVEEEKFNKKCDMINKWSTRVLYASVAFFLLLVVFSVLKVTHADKVTLPLTWEAAEA